jgi:hypothetical protein
MTAMTEIVLGDRGQPRATGVNQRLSRSRQTFIEVIVLVEFELSECYF